MLPGGRGPRPESRQAIALLELMRQAGFTEEEFRKLEEAKANSDVLTVTEFEAMKLVESTGPESEANRARARRMMFGAEYHQAKAGIMKPIDDFFVLVDKRTLAAVQTARKYATALRFIFVAFGLGLMFMLWRTWAALRDTLGGSLDEVHARIARIGNGDFSSAIELREGLENSVLGALSATQARLYTSDRERKRAEQMTEVRHRLIEFAVDHTLDELLTGALDEVCAFAESPIGFYHFVEADQKTLCLQQWSTATLERFCTARPTEMHYGIDQAGVWVDCVHERKPVIHNDYRSLSHKKGLPLGHAEVVRELVVPVMREGKVVAILGVGNKAVDYTEEHVAAVAFLADVTWEVVKRKRAEEVLGRSEERYRTVFDTMIEGFCIIEVLFDAHDRPIDYRFLEINPAFEGQTGLRNAQGKRMRELAPEHEAHWFEIYGKVAATGEPARFENEAKALHRWYDVSACRVGGQDSRKVAILFSDITDRKRGEEALRESESQFRQLANSLPQLVWTCQPDGPCDFLSQQWVAFTGIAEAPQLGFGWLEQLHPEDRPVVVATWQAAVASDTDFRMEFRIRRHDGEYLWFDTMAVRVRDSEGHTLKWFGSNTDITEHKNVEELRKRTVADLERSNRELEQFAYVASHDLQEPLRMVSSYTQLLARRYEGQLDEKARKYIGYAVDGAIRMQSLVGDLLIYSRIGKTGPALEPTDAHAALGVALGNLAAVLEDNRAIVTNDDLPSVRADGGQLAQVFQNLLGNAVKFRRGEDPPHVHVSVRDCGSDWVFAVKDNGIGIDMQYADRIFVIFQRLHTRQEYPGTGIGLAICKRIVERHGGRIWVESEPGVGSTFHFALPK